MKYLIFAALLLVPALSFASSREDADLKNISLDKINCLNVGTSTYDMVECNGKALESADKILNQVYQTQIKKLQISKDPQSKEIMSRLVAAEKAWVAFKAAQCSLDSSADLGGTLEGVERIDCLSEMTIDRVVQIRNLNN